MKMLLCLEPEDNWWSYRNTSSAQLALPLSFLHSFLHSHSQRHTTAPTNHIRRQHRTAQACQLLLHESQPLEALYFSPASAKRPSTAETRPRTFWRCPFSSGAPSNVMVLPKNVLAPMAVICASSSPCATTAPARICVDVGRGNVVSDTDS